MGLSRTVCEINGDFIQKSQFFSPPVYLMPPVNGFPLELGTSTWGQKIRIMWLLGRGRSLTIHSAVWIQYTNVTDSHMDGHRW